MRRRIATGGLALLMMLASAIVAHAQSNPAAFMLYPNYRGLIFDDKPEIDVIAPSGATVTVKDQVSGSTVAVATSTGQTVTISAATLAPNHPYTVVVTQNGTTLEQWGVKPVPASQRATMHVSFDPKGRLLLKGAPTFGLGVYDSGLSYYTDAASYEQAIFAAGGQRQLGGIPLNLYLNYQYGQAPLNAMQALMTTLQSHGMTYLQTGNCFSNGSYTRIPFSIDQSDSYPTQFGQSAGAAGFYIADECVDGLIPETTTHHQRLSGLFTDGMDLAVTLAHGYIDPRKWTDAADVIGSDPYPLYGAEPSQGYSHFIVADYIAQLKNAVHDTRPVFAVLQFFQFTSDSRWPTESEQRAHAIMAIVEGAKGIFWWEVGSNGLQASSSTTITAEMANLKANVSELAALEPVLTADDAPSSLVGNSTRYADPVAGRIAQLQHNIATDWLYSDVQWYQAELARVQAGDYSQSPMLPGAATIRTKVKLFNGKGYVFAYNYTNQTTPVTFTWNQSPGTVTENKTGTSYPVSGSSWSDTFGPYESRIYVIANGGGGGSTALGVSFSNPQPSATVSGSSTVSFAATGGTAPYSYNVTLDGGASIYTGSNASFSWNTTTATNGGHTLKVTTTDAKSQTASASLPLTVSNTTPAALAVSFSSPKASATVSGSSTVAFAATGGTAPYSYAVTLDGGTTLYSGSAGSFGWNTTTATNASHTLKVTATDAKSQTATASVTVTVSNTAPPPPPAPFTASFTYPGSGVTTSGTQTIGMATTATWGQSKTFTLAVDGTTVTSQTLTGTTLWYYWDTTKVADGSHTLTLAVTQNGATATSTMPMTTKNGIGPAPAPPVAVSFTAPTAGATVTGTPTVSFAATGGTAPYSYGVTLDGNASLYSGTAASFGWNTASVANGSHTLKVTVTDAKSQTASASLTVTVSNTPPPPPPASFTASFTYPGTGATTNGTQTIGMATTATWGQSKTFTLSVDGTPITSQTITGTTLWYYWNTTTVANGTHTLTVSVTYNGQTASSSQSITVSN